MKAYVFFAAGFEEIEALTVVDLLRRAEIDVDMVSIEPSLLVKGAHEIAVQTDYTIEEMGNIGDDILVLPGGMPGTVNLSQNDKLIHLLEEHNKAGKKIAAICAAPSILGVSGILKGKKATCFPGFEEKLIGAEIVEERVVHDSNIITSKGLGTAIEFALELIEYVKDKKSSKEIRTSIQF